MLTFHLFTLSLTVLSTFAHPILPRQERSGSVGASLSQASQTLTQVSLSVTPTAPVPTASEPVDSLSESVSEPSASVVSQSASSVSEAVLSTSSEPTPSPSPSEPATESVPTFTPELTIVNKAPVSSVTKYVTAAPEPSGSAVASGAFSGSKSFWDNKAAVIGTFVVVGVVALAIIGLVFYIVRKRKIQESLDSDFFEKFNDNHSERTESRIGNGSPHPSMADMHSQKPMAVNYGATAAMAPHLGFNTNNYQNQNTYGYAVEQDRAPRSHGRPGSGDSFYGASAGVQRMPSYRY